MNRNFELGTRPALTMSVPVRYSAAANYAVVDSGLSNTLQQEEQHHIQQQQQQFQIFQQQQHQQYHQQLFNSYSGLEQQQQQQQQQQQLMQQRSSMSSSVSVSGHSSSSSVSSSSQLPTISPDNPIITVVNSKNKNNNKKKNNNNSNNNNKKMMMSQQQQKHHPKQQQKQQHQQKHHHQKHHQQQHHQQQQKHKPLLVGSGTSIIPASAFKPSMNGVGVGVGGGRGRGAYDDDDMKPTTSAMAAAARAAASATTTAAAAAVKAAASVQSATADQATIANAVKRTEWMRMSDEGRYGTPGAAGLEYQKQQQLVLLEQQQQHQTNNTIDQPMEPSLMDNEMMTTTTTTTTAVAAVGAEDDDNTMDDMNNTPAISQTFVEQLNAMSSDELYNTLKEYDALQDKYHTVLLLPKESRREVTAGGRDGSAYVLRCLKMWYELPSDVLFSAMSLVDRFLDRMAVKPKHMACMSVASFHLAIKQLDLKPIPADDLVTISQCGCTAGDLERMAGVIANKLGVQMTTGQAPITSVSYLRIYYALFRNLAKDIGGEFFEFFQQLIKLEDLENRLEILLCDVKTTVITPSTLALVLICLHLDFHIKESYTRGSPELKHVFEYILFLQQYMRIPDRVFTCGFSIVSGILSHYNGQNKQPYKQRLVWKLSSRTLRVLRPTNRFSSDLPTIDEGIPNAMDDGLRSRTESISSEEEEDWPTSPIIPIFEQC